MIKKHIPNFLTSLNLFFGCLALVEVFNCNMHIASFFIIVAAVFDFSDGFAARFLKAYSDLGKQLDSLADLVSFGLVPSSILFVYIKSIPPTGTDLFHQTDLLAYAAFSITIFSAIRLARFNIDNEQTNSFIGLPTPANALFIISIPLILQYTPVNNFAHQLVLSFTENQVLLVIFVFLSSYLLISGIKLFSLKFKNYAWKRNEMRYIFIGLSIISILVGGFLSIPLIIFLYILLSLTESLIMKR